MKPTFRIVWPIIVHHMQEGIIAETVPLLWISMPHGAPPVGCWLLYLKR